MTDIFGLLREWGHVLSQIEELGEVLGATQPPALRGAAERFLGAMRELIPPPAEP